MNYFSNTMKNILSSSDDDPHFLETVRHTKPVFEKIVPSRYFSIRVSNYI